MKPVKDWLQLMLGRMFLPISRRHAMRIVRQSLPESERNVRLVCRSKPPARSNIYLITSERCWNIVLPWNDGLGGLRGERVILVGKLTGMIHYDGCAGNEG